jgi:hypothetical protein
LRPLVFRGDFGGHKLLDGILDLLPVLRSPVGHYSPKASEEL